MIFTSMDALERNHREFCSSKPVELGAQRFIGSAIKGISQLSEPGDEFLIERWGGKLSPQFHIQHAPKD
ncbi:hypothetical protein GWL_42590 [Herbaspirillum sp. GW103]|nr:hypothetical protein GWL_42590 [Herbaspirillum sp. GW103]